MIIEDEPIAVRILTNYISQVPSLQLARTFKNAFLATDWLRKNEVDLIFLDIHLPKWKGLDFLKSLSSPPAIIITTAYHQYAVEGFDLNVTDYLLKPIEFKRFVIAIDKVQAAKNTQDQTTQKEFIFVRSDGRNVKLLLSEIIFIESQRQYIKIVTIAQDYLCRMTTDSMQKVLPANAFKRIHRSYIIGVRFVNSFATENVEVNRTWLPIGRGYRQVVEELHASIK